MTWRRETSRPGPRLGDSNVKEPDPNATASADLVVGADDLASALSLADAPSFPSVLATARMVALMQVAAARVGVPCLDVGELSVGVAVQVTHTAATPPGAKVTARARYVGREGKLFVFDVAAVDHGGEIGRGRHTRAIVSHERLERGATKRNEISGT